LGHHRLFPAWPRLPFLGRMWPSWLRLASPRLGSDAAPPARTEAGMLWRADWPGGNALRQQSPRPPTAWAGTPDQSRRDGPESVRKGNTSRISLARAGPLGRGGSQLHAKLVASLELLCVMLSRLHVWLSWSGPSAQRERMSHPATCLRSAWRAAISKPVGGCQAVDSRA
jgi:hypothetical protein